MIENKSFFTDVFHVLPTLADETFARRVWAAGLRPDGVTPVDDRFDAQSVGVDVPKTL